MGNEEYLERLRRGVRIWNRWRVVPQPQRLGTHAPPPAIAAASAVRELPAWLPTAQRPDGQRPAYDEGSR
jgi:hypothetical protein